MKLKTFILISMMWVLSAPARSQADFYAYHTKVVHTSTDYFGQYADLIVVMGAGRQLEFTRRTQYLPRWVTPRGTFAVDDFFALVRYCYNQRALNPEFQRITFALFGVATPADLIQDKTRTPFNIGHAVTLHGFSMAEAAHLADGLTVGERDPKTVKPSAR